MSHVKMSEKELLFFKNIGAFMKDKRLQNKKTQSFVANVLGCTFQQIQKYEKASNYIGLWKLIAFCNKFNVNIGEVVSQALDNMYLPEELIKEGKIKVTTVSIKDIANDPTHRLDAIHWLDKQDENN